MPTECSAELFEFAPVERRPVVAGFDGGAITSDAGSLLLGAADRAIGLTGRFAACFIDRRRPDLIEHEVRTLVGQRVFGIALGYEDINDHDELRYDPAMAVLAGKLAARRKDCAPVGGKSTLNRLELSRAVATRYHKIAHDPAAIERLFVTLFLDGHKRPPKEIILDLDATNDPLHGHQEGRFFHGYYGCYCYLPLYVFCGRDLLAAKLRPANIDAAAGAVEEIARIVAQLRERWPRTRIIARADSGFTRDPLMTWCEANGVDYIFGLAKNVRLNRAIGAELAAAREESRTTGQPARRFTEFYWSTRQSWRCRRRVIAKAEWTQDGPVWRSNIQRNHAGQPAAAMVCLDGLCSARQPAPHCFAGDRFGRRHLRHDPPQALQDRRPCYHQRPTHQVRHGVWLSLQSRLRSGSSRSRRRYRYQLSATAGHRGSGRRGPRRVSNHPPAVRLQHKTRFPRAHRLPCIPRGRSSRAKAPLGRPNRPRAEWGVRYPG